MSWLLFQKYAKIYFGLPCLLIEIYNTLFSQQIFHTWIFFQKKTILTIPPVTVKNLGWDFLSLRRINWRENLELRETVGESLPPLSSSSATSDIFKTFKTNFYKTNSFCKPISLKTEQRVNQKLTDSSSRRRRLLYILTSVWMLLRTTLLVKICFFILFRAKKLKNKKKQENWHKI